MKLDKDTLIPIGSVAVVLSMIIGFLSYVSGISSEAKAANFLASTNSTKIQKLEERDIQLMQTMSANQKEIIDRLSKIEGRLSR